MTLAALAPASLAAAVLIAAQTAGAVGRPVVVIDPGHDLRGNPATEPVGPGATLRKIKDGGGTRGVVTGISEADLVLDVSLRLRRLLEAAGVTVVLTRSRTAGTSIGNVARATIANRAHAGLFLRVHAETAIPIRRCAGRTLWFRLSAWAGRTTTTVRAGKPPGSSRRSSSRRCSFLTGGFGSDPISRVSTGRTFR